MDLPIHGKRVGLLIRRQRYKCCVNRLGRGY
nr:transposase family protein [Paenibacillus sp. 1_12]